MAKRIKKYRITPDDSLCLAVSVVDAPAVESEFICLGKQEMEKFVATEKKDRHMIYGCALRSDFPIYRNNGEQEYYIEFGADSIDKISKDFFKNGFQKNWTEGHESEVEGLTVTESWIKESMTLDKSIALGLDPNIACGSWFIGCYCENDDIWNAVKEGKYHGFSCEALVGLEEFEKQMKEDGVEPIEMEDLEAQEPQTEPTVEPTEPTVEEPTQEPLVEEPTQEPTVEEPKPTEEPKPQDNSHLEELINSLRSEIEALKESNTGLQDKLKEMSKQPSAAPINTNAKQTGVGSSTYAQWREQMRNMIG